MLGSNVVAVRNAPAEIDTSDSDAFDYAQEHGLDLYTAGGSAAEPVGASPDVNLIDRDSGTVLGNNAVALRNFPEHLYNASDSEVSDYAQTHGTRIYI